MDSLEDRAVMVKVKNGDLEKMSLLYQRYSRKMFGFFYRMTQDAATSEDLVQNVFMRMLKYRHTFKEENNFQTWAFQLARNVHHDHYRKMKKYHFQETMEDWESSLKEENNEEVEITEREKISTLKKALSALPAEKKELIEMARFQELKYEQIAAIMDLSVSAVKVRIHRTMKELKAHYMRLEQY